MAASAVAAYRTEMYFSYVLENRLIPAEDINTDVPVDICFHVEDDDQYRGDRICNNAVGAAVCTIIITIMLMIIDMLMPCLSAGVSDHLIMYLICDDAFNV